MERFRPRVRAFLKPVSAFDGLVGRPGTVTADKFSVVSSGRFLEYVSLAIPRNSRHSVSSIHKDCTEPRYHALVRFVHVTCTLRARTIVASSCVRTKYAYSLVVVCIHCMHSVQCTIHTLCIHTGGYIYNPTLVVLATTS